MRHEQRGEKYNGGKPVEVNSQDSQLPIAELCESEYNYDSPLANVIKYVEVESELFDDYPHDSFTGLDERSPISNFEILGDKRPLLNLEMYGHETGFELNGIKNNCIFGLYQLLTLYRDNPVNNNKERNIQVGSIQREILNLLSKFQTLNPDKPETLDELLEHIKTFQSSVSSMKKNIMMEYRESSLKSIFSCYTESKVFTILNEYTRRNAELFRNNDEGFNRWLTP